MHWKYKGEGFRIKFNKLNTCWLEVGSQKTEVKSQIFITTFIFKIGIKSDFKIHTQKIPHPQQGIGR